MYLSFPYLEKRKNIIIFPISLTALSFWKLFLAYALLFRLYLLVQFVLMNSCLSFVCLENISCFSNIRSQIYLSKICDNAMQNSYFILIFRTMKLNRSAISGWHYFITLFKSIHCPFQINTPGWKSPSPFVEN